MTPTFLAFAIIVHGWAGARLGERDTGGVELNEGLTDYTRQGNRLFLPFFWGLLAEIEAQGRGAEGALTRVDDALALAVETGEHWSNSFLHRVRGEISLSRDPANTGPAEEAFLTAITIAQQQKARSFELRAALALARLYQSTDRPADAFAVLSPPSRVSRRRRNFRTSLWRKRFSSFSLHKAIELFSDFRIWPIASFRSNAGCRSLWDRNRHRLAGKIVWVGRK